MIEFAVKPPTIPIPFHKLLKVVAKSVDTEESGLVYGAVAHTVVAI